MANEKKGRKQTTTPGSFWNASSNRKRQAILFYLGNNALQPKRFSEIHDNTKGICSSKHTLVVYLRQLVKEGVIARKEVSRRNVEYFLKTSGYKVKKLTLECGQMPIKLAPSSEIRLALVLIGEDRREYVPNDLLPFLSSKGWVFYDSKHPHFKYNYTREGIEFLRSRGIYVERWDWLSGLDDLLGEKELTDLKKRKEFVPVFGKQPEYDHSELERSLEAAKLGRVKEFSVTFSDGRTHEFSTVS